MNTKKFFSKENIIIFACFLIVVICAVIIFIVVNNNNTANANNILSATQSTNTHIDTEEPSQENTNHDLSDTTEDVNSINFDNTYWNLTFGQTSGTQYVARFHADGTILAFCTGSGQFSEGTYKYSSGNLTIDIEQYSNVEFIQIGNEFQSTQKHQMQVGESYYTVSQTDGSYFLRYYEEKQQQEKLKNVKKVFPDCIQNTSPPETNSSVKLGRYKGSFVGLDGGYSYITLHDNQTFSIETNVNHSTHTITSPVSFEGKYVVYKREVTYPDNSTGYSTALILYFDDYMLEWYEAQENYFDSQSSRFEYTG